MLFVCGSQDPFSFRMENEVCFFSALRNVWAGIFRNQHLCGHDAYIAGHGVPVLYFGLQSTILIPNPLILDAVCLWLPGPFSFRMENDVCFFSAVRNVWAGIFRNYLGVAWAASFHFHPAKIFYSWSLFNTYGPSIFNFDFSFWSIILCWPFVLHVFLAFCQWFYLYFQLQQQDCFLCSFISISFSTADSSLSTILLFVLFCADIF
jgi:hypothetical protein